jgi:protein arginine kinase
MIKSGGICMNKEQTGKELMSDVVISSRVRLARNIKGYIFPGKISEGHADEVRKKVKNAVLNSGNTVISNFVFMDMAGLSQLDRQVLVEKHLISRDMLDEKKAKGVIISRDEKISLLINEEDHIRIQCLFPGMQMERASQLCSKIDNLLEEKLEFAFSNEFGYLTSCPTNVGTGMRASVMLHLPALSMTGYIKSILEACTKLGVAVRGVYGEHSEALGDMFQMSNQVTLGQTEEEIVTSIKSVVSQILEQERNLRKKLYEQNPYKFEDRIFRSLGLFKNARIITSDESYKLISDVRLGVYMGIIKDVDIKTLNELMLLLQPASLQKHSGKNLSVDERDIKRAELVRKVLV